MEAASIESLGANKPVARAIATALAVHGIRSRPDASLRIVIVDDYLHRRLAEYNARALASKKAWLLANPHGPHPSVGPLFVPGRTACWECLAYRLRLNGYLAAASTVNPATVAADTCALVAAESARWLSAGKNTDLEGQIRLIQAGELESPGHRVTRRPQCPVCGDGSRSNRVPEPLVHHISPVTGIISKLEKLPNLGDFAVYLAHGSQIFRPDRGGRLFLANRMTAVGGGWTDEEALRCCLGEAIERYSTQWHGDEPRVRASYRQLKGAALDPRALLLFSNQQYRNRRSWNSTKAPFHRVPEPLDDNSQIEWTQVQNLTGGDPRYVPSAYCYLGYGVDYCGADTNGCAAAPTIEEALLRGFLELVERDAVALWWYNRARRPAVDLASFDSARIDLAADWIIRRNRRLHVLDLTTDLGIPAMVAISGKQTTGSLLMGAAAELDAGTAILRALTALAKLTAFAEAGRWRHRAVRPGLLLPVRGAKRTAADFPRLATRNLRNDLRDCLRIARRADLEVYALDMTRPEVNLPVARVIVPRLRHWWARFAPGRLYDVPVSIGWRHRALTESELNPVPFFL